MTTKRRPTKLLVLTTSFPSFSGDPSGSFVAELAHALTPHGFESEVVALEADKCGALAMLESGKWPQLAAAVLHMGARARRPVADAVLSHWLVPSALIGESLGLPHVGIAHGGDVRILERTPWLRRWLVRRLDGVIAVSNEMAHALDGPRTLVAPMGVCSDALGPIRPMPGPPLRLLFLGRLVPIKGLATLIDAVAPLSGVSLTVVGGGPDERLRETAGRNVTFLGPVDLSARRALFAEHHVVCIPSLSGEGSPRVAVEALTAGRPVLASAVGGLPEQVAAQWLLPPGDVVAWRARITELAQNIGKINGYSPPGDVDWAPVSARIAEFMTRCFSRKITATVASFASNGRSNAPVCDRI